MCQKSCAVAIEEVVSKDFSDEAHFGCEIVLHVPVGWLKYCLEGECAKSVLVFVEGWSNTCENLPLRKGREITQPRARLFAIHVILVLPVLPNSSRCELIRS